MNGVVLMAYGTPRRREDVAVYYTDIRRGRPPSEEELADLIRRYDAIGGLSPLIERTEAQRAMLAKQLEKEAPGEYTVAVGLRHAEPSIETAVESLAEAGATRIVGLVLAPHYSAMSVGVYLRRAAEAAANRDISFAGIESWATEPAYVDVLAADVKASLDVLPENTHVLFTAHSLPRRILDTVDPYPSEVAATATVVASAAGLADDRWSIAWQSAGRTAEPWLEPDLLGTIDSLAASQDVDAVLVCPCGFVADHLEVLYDLDVEARQRAEPAGLTFRRTPVVNDDSGVMAALARRIVATASTP
ncbi:MAG TPA: ferrochelatase [Desertimonas sp.]|nr:ferrochelatase [Desertimonas sp.]